MNIWIFNHYATTPDFPGATRHFDFSKELVKRGHKVTIFASSFHYLLLKETKNYVKSFFIEEKVYENNDSFVKFVWIKTPPYEKSDWKRVVNMLVYSYRSFIVGNLIGKKEKPDIIIGSSVHLFAPLSAYFLSRKFNVPFILEIRDIWPQTLIDLGISKYHPFILLLSILEKFLYRRAQKIITLLPNSKNYFEKFGVEKKLIWIPNGFDVERIQGLEKETSPIQSEDSKFLKIGYAGAMGKGNDLHFLINLGKYIKDNSMNVKFYIMGSGYEQENFKKNIIENGLEDIILFQQTFSKNDIHRVLSFFDAFIFHIADANVFKYGISSNKLFDYMAVGKPIIFFANVPNNIVQEAGCGITVKNLDEVIDAIKKLMNLSEEERKEMGLKGKKFVEKNYSIQFLADKFENVIKEVREDYLKKL